MIIGFIIYKGYDLDHYVFEFETSEYNDKIGMMPFHVDAMDEFYSDFNGMKSKYGNYLKKLRRASTRTEPEENDKVKYSRSINIDDDSDIEYVSIYGLSDAYDDIGINRVVFNYIINTILDSIL